MRVLYIECNMGAAGDMLTAALLELVDNPQEYVHRFNHLLDGVEVELSRTEKCGIYGNHISVKIDGQEEHEHHHHHHHDHDHDHGHHHSHNDMGGIAHVVYDHIDISNKIREDAMQVYELIAYAESHAHNMPMEYIHFHEVGEKDAIVDVVSVCILMDALKVDKVVVSPIHVGSGHVHCAHGILPVPAPATAHILRDVPTYQGNIQGELCTPTGAALLKYFATEFGKQPIMKVEKIGYGMGNKDFEQANCVRVFLGECEDETEDIIELKCNIDDMTSEEVGYAFDRLFEAGALDVYTQPIGMKKNRPGILLSVMCQPEKRDEMVKAIFKHTTTIGIREQSFTRYTLTRENHTIETKFGLVQEKKVYGYGVSRSKFEYEDLVKIAKENNLSIQEVRKQLK
ncbi:MAG: nickel pincer cofactor biosynthesis protein LarC [Firmicutes bacterium]|nr:nickel pincer cofactor biosynthesis protein LarC [Bacillota bacterium]